MKQVNCTGSYHGCPSEASEYFKPDLTVCYHGTKVCNRGVSGGGNSTVKL